MKHVIIFLIFNLSLTVSYAQENRGKELSHYIFPEFTPGVVLMKSGIEHNVLLNYNSLTEEMIFDEKGKKLAIPKEEQERIDTVFIGDRKFITLNGKFVELLYHSKCDLYAEHRCNVKYPGKAAGYGGTSETTAVDSYSSFYSRGIMYELKLPDGFETRPYIIYWLNKNGKMEKFVSMRQLTKFYNDKEVLLKDYVSNHEVTYDNPESIGRLIKYLEEN
ncbi:MAG: hypothetical protein WCD55_08620 [Bacteroidales bacterium]